MSTVLEVTNLCKTYIVNKSQHNVLRNINFTLHEGEFVSIMGPSGSGKSTLLYTVSGMDRLTAGEVLFNRKKLSVLSQNEMAEVRLHEMGFIFQQMYMLGNLSVYDNIILSGYQAIKGKGDSRSRSDINEYADKLMRKLGIIEIAGHDIAEVSGGQLQRACICRALINAPRMLFADEPTGALNSKAAKEVMEELCRINREGTTIMIVTHDVKVAAQTDKVLYMVDGNIQGELKLGKSAEAEGIRERERRLNEWLMEQGW
ncbi:ABC transporter ATP-binding protein [Paenibacillus sp. FSL R7-0273]|uniref:ABC transporter ATP-binding protein n=1 Tax=Paenibacillus sp. FSL R7-0273 TaxID=1536772 RepID=UPI0004F8EF14|nr:ABC transporter ATP-binding protein [Paenibacillus sp. FSL R7-0273]AIQ47117.1 ABC transporter ATP-binding protein [Paenibacillus sp. FSL R7-0273]OMF97128.1 ABC transporter ATP-binding protein [Paenibacillus sp. FSL R7-0273]